MPPAVSPVEGLRVSSEYGMRLGLKHGGIDIATVPDAPVYAMYAGRVGTPVVSGRARWQPAHVGPVHTTGRSGDGFKVHNSDGELQVYNHMLPARNPGEYVAAGDLLGHVNLSGITSGWHLHFETWNAKGLTVNPRLHFNAHGILVGSKPVLPEKPPVAGGSDDVRAVQQLLTQLGYYGGAIDGINGPVTIAAVRQYQDNQVAYGGADLFIDGDWGPATQAWYSWVASQAQPSLNYFNGALGQVRISGDYTAAFADQVRTVQRRNGLVADGVLGNIMAAWMRTKGSRISNRP